MVGVWPSPIGGGGDEREERGKFLLGDLGFDDLTRATRICPAVHVLLDKLLTRYLLFVVTHLLLIYFTRKTNHFFMSKNNNFFLPTKLNK